VVAILDSNSEPKHIDYPVPGNDDAIRAINLYCDLIADAVLDGIQAELSASGADLGEAPDAGETVPDEEDTPAEAGQAEGESGGASGEQPAEAATAGGA
jgi:small subunit ribosomal protein S2